jgi:hypothetical protein
MTVSTVLVLEMPIYGILVLWLVALAPAALVTLAKGRVLTFACGLLALGLPWIVGAVALASPESGWAQRFYGAEKLARATDPIRFRRQNGQVILWCLGVTAAVFLVGFIAARPTALLGVDRGALQRSVGGVLLDGTCAGTVDDRTWKCRRYDDQLSGTVDYRVSVDRLGCWEAVRVGRPGEGSRRRISGCVTVVDFVV